MILSFIESSSYITSIETMNKIKFVISPFRIVDIQVYDMYYWINAILVEGLQRVKKIKTYTKKRLGWESIIGAGIGLAMGNPLMVGASAGSFLMGSEEEKQKTVIENGQRIEGLDNLECQIPCKGMMYREYIDE